MSFSSQPIQWYHSHVHVDPIWPDGTFKCTIKINGERHGFVRYWYIYCSMNATLTIFVSFLTYLVPGPVASATKNCRAFGFYRY
jgi:hypothetical protein